MREHLAARWLLKVIKFFVGDVDSDTVIGYEVLCRRHHMRQITHAVAKNLKEIK